MKKLIPLLFLLLGLHQQLRATFTLFVDFKTGNDNLEFKPFQENPEIRLIFHNRADIIKTNINNGKTWPNNSIRREVFENIPGNYSDLKEIHIYRRPLHNQQSGTDHLQKDNWTIKELVVTARTVRYNPVTREEELVYVELLQMAPAGNVFRFIYDGGDNIREGTFFKARLSERVNSSISRISLTENAVITARIGTGQDNLEGGDNNNVNLLIHFEDSPAVITISNLNKKAKWENHTIHTVTSEIPNSRKMDINKISNIYLVHTGGGGSFADNWDLTEFNLTIQQGNNVRLLVRERTGYHAPLHRFTGEVRRKEFRAVPLLFNDEFKNSVFLTAVFGTGNDNLKGGEQSNIYIEFKIEGEERRYSILDLNEGQKWESYSIHTVRNRHISSSAHWDLNKFIQFRIVHTGGNGSFDDNTWDLEKLKITLTKSGKTRVLYDDVLAPIHRFRSGNRIFGNRDW